MRWGFLPGRRQSKQGSRPARNLYEVLEVEPSASPEAITAAYRRLIFVHHPDRSTAPDAVAKAAAITHAYSVLSNPAERARYDKAHAGEIGPSHSDIPRAVLGTSQLMLYDLLEHRPRHGHVRWEEGIWSGVSGQFADCRARGCLVLLKIDPSNQHQVYQHGDPGPVMEIDPSKGEFALLKAWLQRCHDAEGPAPSPKPPQAD